MDDLVIDDVDESVVERLQARAARNGRALNDEIVEILRVAGADAVESEASPRPPSGAAHDRGRGET